MLLKYVNKNMLNKNKLNKICQNNYLYFSVIFFVFLETVCNAGLSFQGPSGFVNVPSHKTIKEKEIELSVKTRMYNSYKGDKTKDGNMTTVAFGFSPIKDLELGIQADLDSEQSRNNVETDPKLSFKVKIPSIGEGEFSEVAFGGVFDTNPNNYHTLYLTVGGLGLGWNFGGNDGVGTASYGKYKTKDRKPESLCLLFGTELPGRKLGERGYKSQYVIDYNGDVFSLGWRYYSNRGFSVEVIGSTKTSYDVFYDYKPLTLGIGANF
jgi:hypothetical protein